MNTYPDLTGLTDEELAEHKKTSQARHDECRSTNDWTGATFWQKALNAIRFEQNWRFRERHGA